MVSTLEYSCHRGAENRSNAGQAHNAIAPSSGDEMPGIAGVTKSCYSRVIHGISHTNHRRSPA